MFGSCASAIKSTLLPPDTNELFIRSTHIPAITICAKFPVMIDAPDNCKLTKIFLSRQI